MRCINDYVTIETLIGKKGVAGIRKRWRLGRQMSGWSVIRILVASSVDR